MKSLSPSRPRAGGHLTAGIVAGHAARSCTCTEGRVDGAVSASAAHAISQARAPMRGSAGPGRADALGRMTRRQRGSAGKKRGTWSFQGPVNLARAPGAAIGKHGKSAQRRVVGWVGTWREVSLGLGSGCEMVANQTHSELVE